MVIGGSDSVNYLSSVEIIDLSNDINNCQPVEDYPLPTCYESGTFHSGRGMPVQCGLSDCYGYQAATDQWDRVEDLNAY